MPRLLLDGPRQDGEIPMPIDFEQEARKWLEAQEHDERSIELVIWYLDELVRRLAKRDRSVYARGRKDGLLAAEGRLERIAHWADEQAAAEVRALLHEVSE